MGDDGRVAPFHRLAGAYVNRRRAEAHEAHVDDGSRIGHGRVTGWVAHPTTAWRDKDRGAADTANGQRLLCASIPSQLRRHGVPDTIYLIARDVAGCLVFDIGIKGLAIVSPLQGAVVAFDHGEITNWLVTRRSSHRRPISGTFALAGRFTRRVFVEGIEGHSLGIGEYVAH